ncbi:flagellar hook-associated protein FlgK [Asaia astilbis]|uniref:flagellar hook-associated protein FlgK n=1 Tax=Asaia astilbis TaxID=610244 RepID=UPI0004714012|nr:flagellar hook-associated protein FlgK [Asaia astilbis]
MNLLSSISMATGTMKSIEAQYALLSNNVSNASTTGYVRETVATVAQVAGGIGVGSRLANTQLAVNQALQSTFYRQNATASSYDTLNSSLSALSAVQGSTSADSGSTTSLSDQLGNLQSSLISLTSTPSQSAAQSAVINNATALTNTIHTLASTYTTQRQAAADNVVSIVSSVNSDLTQIGALSQQIIKFQAKGQDTADLENQRLGVMSDLSSSLSVTFSTTSNGDMIVRTENGVQLPTRPDQIGQDNNTQTLPSSTWPLTTSSATIDSSNYYSAQDPNSVPAGIMLKGQDITSSLTGGELGANVSLRDSVYPQMQAQLDSFSYTMMNRVNSAGLSLFTTSSGGSSTVQSTNLNLPSPQGIVGLSSTLSVNATYAATPSLLVTTTNSDGTTNSNDTSVISKVLSVSFGSDPSDVSGSLLAPTSGLGPNGALSTGYSGSQGLLALSSALTSNQGATIASASSGLTSSTAVLTTLQTKIASTSGVVPNDELAKTVTLQAAYSANAKIISIAQTMFSALINAIQ